MIRKHSTDFSTRSYQKMLPGTYFKAKLESSESQSCNTEFKRYSIMAKKMLLQTYCSFYLSDQEVSMGEKNSKGCSISEREIQSSLMEGHVY